MAWMKLEGWMGSVRKARIPLPGKQMLEMNSSLNLSVMASAIHFLLGR